MKWILHSYHWLSPLFLAMSVLSFMALHQEPLVTQQHAKSISHKTIGRNVVHIMPTPSIPDAPTYISLGLKDASTQKWITLAWHDAYAVETNKSDNTFPVFFIKQIKAESNFEPYDAYGNALGSHAGAIGIAQFEPGTAASHGINPYDPTSSLLGAAKLMVSYVHKYNSYDMALAAYNAGEGRMDGCLQTSNWRGCIPQETRTYIYEITGD